MMPWTLTRNVAEFAQRAGTGFEPLSDTVVVRFD
jgi:hypothetical protein